MRRMLDIAAMLRRLTYLNNLTHTPGQNGHHCGRRHVQMDFHEWKWKNSDSNFTESCSQESNWQLTSSGSDNGFIWTNVDPVHRRNYAARGGYEWMHAHEIICRELIFSLNTNCFLCAEMFRPSQYKNAIIPILLTTMMIVRDVERPIVLPLTTLRNHFSLDFSCLLFQIKHVDRSKSRANMAISWYRNENPLQRPEVVTKIQDYEGNNR